jgi:hypothetical protein
MLRPSGHNRKSAANVRSWSVASAAIIEIVATLLTVKLLIPMSGMEKAVSEVDTTHVSLKEPANPI